MPVNKPVNKQIREERLKTNQALIGGMTQLLYICDVFGASRTMANLIEEITIDEKDGIISREEAEDLKLDTLRLLSNTEKRCKCFEMPDIF